MILNQKLDEYHEIVAKGNLQNLISNVFKIDYFECNVKMEQDNANSSLIQRMLQEFPYSPSSLSVIDAALDLAEFKPNDVFTDLGCGDGTVLIRASERFGVFSVGFEINSKLVKMAKTKAKASGFKNLIEIVHADLFKIDISRFNVIYVYPYPPVVRSLSDKIAEECKKGSRILVHDYALKNLQPTKTVQIAGSSFHTHTIYLYKL
ncbi:MAG: class I SAM-dependent methyltransferase [Candidatus Bathyarchaeia archaeon]